MDVFNIISLVIGFIGLAIGLAGILAGYRIAKKSGAFRRVELDILLMNQSLTREPQTNRVVFGNPVGEDEKALVVCILPFMIHNKGELSAKNVQFRLVFPLEIRAVFNEKEVFEKASLMGFYTKSDLRRNTFDNEGHRYIDYMFPEVQPKTSGVAEEGIQLNPLLIGIQIPVEAVTKNGIPLKVVTRVQMKKATITVGLSAENVENITTQLDVEVCPAQNIKELNEKIMERETEALREELVQKYESRLPEHKRKEFRENFVSKVYAD
ncbi:hypothetical protein M1N05_01790, partial [Dehalococcoidales bacterium]|nr:hypothetical protein [Dehalococcoidales bacterium]